MKAQIETEPSFVPGVPVVLMGQLDIPGDPGRRVIDFAVAKDGRILTQSVGGEDLDPIVVTVNWPSLLGG